MLWKFEFSSDSVQLAWLGEKLVEVGKDSATNGATKSECKRPIISTVCRGNGELLVMFDKAVSKP